jgi:predicted amidophosphoribosyltransferase
VVLLDADRREDHAYLTATDHCGCLTEYRTGTRGNDTLALLIMDLKCPPSSAAANPQRRRRKQVALETIARALRSALSRAVVEGATWVPIPPSRALDDPDYDPRLEGALRIAFGDYDLDLRRLLYQCASTPADHAARRRQTAATLYRLLRIDPKVLQAQPLRSRVVLFDDLLTSGKHFKCCQCRLRESIGEVPIHGLFVARRTLSRYWRGLPRCRG